MKADILTFWRVELPEWTIRLPIFSGRWPHSRRFNTARFSPVSQGAGESLFTTKRVVRECETPEPQHGTRTTPKGLGWTTKYATDEKRKGPTMPVPHGTALEFTFTTQLYLLGLPQNQGLPVGDYAPEHQKHSDAREFTQVNARGRVVGGVSQIAHPGDSLVPPPYRNRVRGVRGVCLRDRDLCLKP